MPTNLNKSETMQPDFEKAELDLLKEGLKRTYTERFKMMTTLMKMNFLYKKAKITHKTYK